MAAGRIQQRLNYIKAQLEGGAKLNIDLINMVATKYRKPALRPNKLIQLGEKGGIYYQAPGLAERTYLHKSQIERCAVGRLDGVAAGPGSKEACMQHVAAHPASLTCSREDPYCW